MKNLFTFLIGIILFVTVNAQTPQLNWAKSFNGKSSSTDSTSVMKMNVLDNSIYIAGTSDAYGKANDIVLIKRDYLTGDTLWTSHYNGPANADDQVVDMVINQSTGDIYVTGKSTGLNTGYDIVILKYSPKGTLALSKRWDNNYHGDDIPKSIGIDFNGRIYVSGSTFNGNRYLEDLLVLRYDSDGNLYDDITSFYQSNNFPFNYSKDLVGGSRVNNQGQIFIAGDFMMGDVTDGWSAVYAYGVSSSFSENYNHEVFTQSCTGRYLSPYYTGFPRGTALYSPDDFNIYNAMDLDNSNNIYLAYLNDTIKETGNGYKICIAKISGSGCTIWEKNTGRDSNRNNLRINSIKADTNGNVYAAGYEKNSSGNFDWFVIKYNNLGVFQWRVTKKGTGNGNDIPNDIAFDNLQNPVVVGVTKNTGTNNDITCVKYNKANGAELFSINYDSANSNEKAYNIIVDASQKIIINGIVTTVSQSQNMVTLNYCIPPETPIISLLGNALHSDAETGNQWYNQTGAINGATTQDYSPKTSGDYYVVVSINGCNSSSSNKMKFIPTGINPLEWTKSIKLYPNPVTNELTIELDGNTTKTNFEIINSIGQAVFAGTINEKIVVQTAGYAPGIYLIKLGSGTTFEFKKIIKN